MSHPLITDPPALDNAGTWDALLEAVGPASLLVVIESRMSGSLRRQATPEDIWQETLLHAWRDRARCEWRGIKAFRAWLLSIIDNRIRHLAAQSATQKRGAVRTTSMSALEGGGGLGTGSSDTGFPGPVGSTTPSRIAIFREQAAAMQDALSSIPEDMREVVRLRLFEQLTLGACPSNTGFITRTPFWGYFRCPKGRFSHRKVPSRESVGRYSDTLLEEIAEKEGLSVSAVRRRFGKGVELYEAALRWPAARARITEPPRRQERQENVLKQRRRERREEPRGKTGWTGRQTDWRLAVAR